MLMLHFLFLILLDIQQTGLCQTVFYSFLNIKMYKSLIGPRENYLLSLFHISRDLLVDSSVVPFRAELFLHFSH